MKLDIHALARPGAEALLRQILQEFPELRAIVATSKKKSKTKTTPKKKGMSAAGKARIGAGIRAYWKRKKKEAELANR